MRIMMVPPRAWLVNAALRAFGYAGPMRHCSTISQRRERGLVPKQRPALALPGFLAGKEPFGGGFRFSLRLRGHSAKGLQGTERGMRFAAVLNQD
ncbi:MAG: hypothetical protein E5W56_21220, partial [Mesorhizobium sp.]